MIAALAHVIAFITAIVNLRLTGDYVPIMAPYLGPEDSPLVDLILTLTGR